MTITHLIAGAAMFAAAGSALASVTVPFPQDSSTYFSATNGGGTIGGNGGETEFMWSVGDYVDDSYIDTGFASAGRIYGSFDIFNLMGGAADAMRVGVFVNGVLVGSVSVPECSYCGERQTYSYDFSFGPTAGDDYVLRYVLGDTRAGGDGSLKFYGGSRTTLDLGVVPEPATWAMMIAGFGLVGSALRRRREAIA